MLKCNDGGYLQDLVSDFLDQRDCTKRTYIGFSIGQKLKYFLFYNGINLGLVGDDRLVFKKVTKK